jgi:hypothetical protein
MPKKHAKKTCRGLKKITNKTCQKNMPKKHAKRNRCEKCCEKKSVRKIPILCGICYIEVEPPTYFVNYGLSPNSIFQRSYSKKGWELGTYPKSETVFFRVCLFLFHLHLTPKMSYVRPQVRKVEPSPFSVYGSCGWRKHSSPILPPPSPSSPNIG